MESSASHKQSNSFWLLLIFIINPFLSLVVSFRDYLSKYSQNIMCLFCGFYGYTFFPLRSSMDSYRHRQDFMYWTLERDLDFNHFVERLYSEDVNYVDIALPLLKYLISRFTDDVNVFYGILGLLFGYFFSRNIWFLINFYGKNLNKFTTLFIFAFAFFIPPWEINSFRFWIAAHIFVFFSFKIFFSKQKSAYLGLLITPFIHFGFIFALVLFGIYKFVGNRLLLYFIFFVGAIFMNEINLSTIQNTIPKTSIALLDKKTTSYSSEGYIEHRDEGAMALNWYVKLKFLPLKYITIFLVFLIFIKHRKQIERSNLLPLFCFALFSFSLTHALMNSVPVFGRYNRMSLLFLYATFFLLFQSGNNVKWYRSLFPFHAFAALFFIIIDIRSGFDTMTIDTLISNPVIALFYQSNESVINFIK